jgi:hypothetical protein
MRLIAEGFEIKRFPSLLNLLLERGQLGPINPVGSQNKPLRRFPYLKMITRRRAKGFKNCRRKSNLPLTGDF